MIMPRIKPRLTALALAATVAALGDSAHAAQEAALEHVLLISVDGMHQVDLERFVAGHPGSAFARLLSHGVEYRNAHTARPSDSFPGLLAFMTGGSPKSHGVFYDDSYDRTLFAPGSNCLGTPGTEAQFAENIDFDLTKLDGGGPPGSNHIDPAQLPLRLTGQKCEPVLPHDFLRTNTIMEVIHAAGRRTAWSDKHPAYEIVSGQSGKGLDELYTPEINSSTAPGGAVWTDNPAFTRQYDELKVTGVINQIHGFDHTGVGRKVGVPAIFGMNFQSVSVGQKVTADGYLDAAAKPSPELELSLEAVDGALGRMFDALDAEKLTAKTLFIVGAKHGQSPIDVNQLHMKVGNKNPKLLPGHADVADPFDLLTQGGIPLAQETSDDVALIWLKDQTKTAAAVAILQADQQSLNSARIQKIYAGAELITHFGTPAGGRTPDIIIQPIPGTIYSKSSAKISEHGGFADDDTHVLLVVSNPGLEPRQVVAQVANKQVAPTILRALGLNPRALDAVRMEGTRVLPGLEMERDDD
jgi:hypothetical protein